MIKANSGAEESADTEGRLSKRGLCRHYQKWKRCLEVCAVLPMSGMAKRRPVFNPDALLDIAN